MSFARKTNFSVMDLITPEDSTPVGAAMNTSAMRPSMENRVFSTAKVLLWTGMAFIMSMGISLLQ